MSSGPDTLNAPNGAAGTRGRASSPAAPGVRGASDRPSRAAEIGLRDGADSPPPGSVSPLGLLPDLIRMGARGIAPRVSSLASLGLPNPGTLPRMISCMPRVASDALHLMMSRPVSGSNEDEWGFDEGLAESITPFFDFLYCNWWRVETTGAHNVPATGGALLVANHAGAVPWDATMLQMAIMREHPLPRHVRFLVHPWAFEVPFFGTGLRKCGGVPASADNARRLLEEHRLVAAFPEGAKGAGKLYRDRYRLQRFGRGGFAAVALRTGVPIIPVAIVGSEEVYPKLGEMRPLARVLGMPDLPVTPTFPLLGPLGALPLPSRWRIEFCQPIDLSDYGPEAAENRGVVFEISEAVRAAIQENVDANLVTRGSPFV